MAAEDGGGTVFPGLDECPVLVEIEPERHAARIERQRLQASRGEVADIIDLHALAVEQQAGVQRRVAAAGKRATVPAE